MPVPLPAKKTMKLVMRASAPGKLERVIEEDSIIVFAWPSSDMYASIDSLVDKLDRQILKHKEKNADHRSNGVPKAPEPEPSE